MARRLETPPFCCEWRALTTNLIVLFLLVGLANVFIDPISLPLLATYVLRSSPRSLRTHAGFHPSRALCIPPSVRPSPCPKHLGVPTLSARRVPSVVSSRVSSLSSEYVLILQSVGDPITRSLFLPCLSYSLAVDRTVILTSVSGSLAALGTASSRLALSWLAWNSKLSGMPRFLSIIHAPPLFRGLGVGDPVVAPGLFTALFVRARSGPRILTTTAHLSGLMSALGRNRRSLRPRCPGTSSSSSTSFFVFLVVISVARVAATFCLSGLTWDLGVDRRRL